MLSPIMPTISLTIEDIPNLDIFANGANITNFNTDYCRPMFSTEGASLLVDELGQAGLEASSFSDMCHATRMRKQTACETDLELSLESNSSELLKPAKRKQSLLEGLEHPRASKFDTILLEDDDSTTCAQEFLGKRSPLSDHDICSPPTLHAHKSANFEGRSSHADQDLSTPTAQKKTCALGHRLGPMSAGASDCYLCRSVAANIKRFAEEKGGSLLSAALGLEVTLSCENGHEWTVCYRKATKGWCKDCKVKRKLLLKEMLQAEDERITAERKMKQEKLFEDARKRILKSEDSKKQ